jgi:hypothetical protein
MPTDCQPAADWGRPGPGLREALLLLALGPIRQEPAESIARGLAKEPATKIAGVIRNGEAPKTVQHLPVDHPSEI